MQTTYDDNNIFAKILRNEAPCIKIFEDEHSLAFMDVMPQTNKLPALSLIYLTNRHWPV